MTKIYYNEQGWVCERYPYDIPIEDENLYLEVDDTTYQMTLNVETFKAWKVENGQLVIRQKEVIPSKVLYEQEFQEIQEWFISTDYIPNKIITGEWEATDSRWIDYKLERIRKRQRQDELKFLLGI